MKRRTNPQRAIKCRYCGTYIHGPVMDDKNASNLVVMVGTLKRCQTCAPGESPDD